MGKTNQERIRRKLSQAHRNCDKVITDLADVAEQYAGAHEELAELLRVVCVSVGMAQEMIERFCMAAWGRVPEDWETWRNARQTDELTSDAPSD